MNSLPHQFIKSFVKKNNLLKRDLDNVLCPFVITHKPMLLIVHNRAIQRNKIFVNKKYQIHFTSNTFIFKKLKLIKKKGTEKIKKKLRNSGVLRPKLK
jgi:hypothetical protein